MAAWTPSSDDLTALAGVPDHYQPAGLLHAGERSRAFRAQRDGALQAHLRVVFEAKTGAAEARILRGLDHPGIPKLIDEFQASQGYVLVTELAEGATLARLLAEGRYRHDEAFTIRLVARAADVLAYLHALRPPIVHRDASPRSWILRADGSPALVGFASATDDPRVALSGGPPGIGTLGYVPAEQYDQGIASPSSDVFALGATFAHLLTGLAPRDIPRKNMAPDLAALGVSPAVADLIAECMHIDATARPRASDIARRSREIAPSGAETPSAPPSSARWPTSAAAHPSAAPDPFAAPHPSALPHPPAAAHPSTAPDPSTAPHPSALPHPPAAAHPSTAPDPSTAPGPSAGFAPAAASDPPARTHPAMAPHLPAGASPSSSRPHAAGAAAPEPEGTAALPESALSPVIAKTPEAAAVAPLPRPASRAPATKEGRLEELWAKVLAAPLDQETNEKFVQFGVQSGQYQAAAGKYMALEANAPAAEVKESAQRFRRQIGLMAATRIMAANPKSAAPRTTNLTKVCFLFGGAGLTLAIILGKWWLALLAMPCFVLGVESYRRSRRAG